MISLIFGIQVSFGAALRVSRGFNIGFAPKEGSSKGGGAL